ncbi:MAG: uroporphyrinogen decarboxylase family protein, partial [Stellaceae bacterium]
LHLAHRSAAAHKLHSIPQRDMMNLISGMVKPAAGYRPLACSSPEAVQTTGTVAWLDLARVIPRLEPVLETVRRVSAVLGAQTAMIGFAGSPWTVATYMVEGGGSRDFRRIKSWGVLRCAGI